MEVVDFFFNDTATTEIYTLSLHDALPIFLIVPRPLISPAGWTSRGVANSTVPPSRLITPLFVLVPAVKRSVLDRKSTRLKSSHAHISYAVFCLLKKNSFLPLHSFSPFFFL